jgi:hypothetical protein
LNDKTAHLDKPKGPNPLPIAEEQKVAEPKPRHTVEEEEKVVEPSK